MRGNHPTFAQDDFTIVAEKGTGRIVSSLNLISQTWTYAGDTTNGVDYTLTSLAKDGIASTNNGGMTNDFNCDILFSVGQFFQWPQGTQT